MVEMGEALTNEVEIGPVVTQLVERLPELLGLHFAALYLPQNHRLQRVAGPTELPAELPVIGILHDFLKNKGPLLRMDELAPIRLLSAEVEQLGDELGSTGVEVVGLLATTRRSVGIMLLSGKTGQTALEREELDLLRGLLNQASIALETNLLLDERARQAEFERELKIAASIQSSLLPATARSRRRMGQSPRSAARRARSAVISTPSSPADCPANTPLPTAMSRANRSRAL